MMYVCLWFKLPLSHGAIWVQMCPAARVQLTTPLNLKPLKLGYLTKPGTVILGEK